MGGVTATSLTIQVKGCIRSSRIISIIFRITQTIILQNSMPFFDGFEWSLNQSDQPRRCFFSPQRLMDIWTPLPPCTVASSSQINPKVLTIEMVHQEFKTKSEKCINALLNFHWSFENCGETKI